MSMTFGAKLTRYCRIPFAAMCFAAFIFGLSACGENSKHKQLKEYASAVKTRKPQPIEPIPPIKKVPTYQYPNEEQRDPFIAFRSKTKEQNGPNHSRAKQPLETFPLDSLRMVGVLRQDNEVWAIISAPDGAVYRISVGGYMGQHYGQVRKIDENQLMLVENLEIAGHWEKRPVIIKLEDENEEK